MTMWENIFLAIVIACMLFWLYRGIKGQPEAFSKANLTKSLGVLGVLALFLIVIVALLVSVAR